MANKKSVTLTQQCAGKNVGDKYDGPLAEWLADNGYATEDKVDTQEQVAADLEKKADATSGALKK